MEQKWVAIVVVAVVAAAGIGYFLITGQNTAPSQPEVNILPANPQESDFQNQYDNFKLIATASATDSEGNPITYSYQWFKNGEAISGATSSELSATLMGRQGHTVRGYEFKVQVTASDGHGNHSVGESAVTMGGPSFTKDKRGVLFHNIFRVHALNGAANSSLTAMKSHTNSNWVSIGIIYFQAGINDTIIYEKSSLDPSIPSTIAESDLIGLIQYAHSLGLKVMIYPEIWIDGYAVGPRDQIPGSPEWFTAYQAKMVHLAEIAEANQVELFSVGVELWYTEDKEESWRQLIQAVRSRYSRALTYSAQYYPGRIDTINWFDAVDYIGASCLFEIPTGGMDMTLTDLVAWYSGYRDTIQQASTKFGKPVLITEIAAYSLDGVTVWGGSANIHSTTQDLQEQADYFEACFETFADQAWVEGIWVEDWVPTQETWYQNDPQWPTSTAFLNKPAERVIRSWFTQ